MPQTIRTDLAQEAASALETSPSGVESVCRKVDGVAICRVQIRTPAAAEQLAKAEGNYITLEAERGEDFAEPDRRERERRREDRGHNQEIP